MSASTKTYPRIVRLSVLATVMEEANDTVLAHLHNGFGDPKLRFDSKSVVLEEVLPLPEGAKGDVINLRPGA